MASMKYDLPLLDRDTRFSLWQVKMRALLAQADYDDALDSFGGKANATWTPDEKKKDRKALAQIQLHLHNNILQEVLKEDTAATLWSKLESICMSKDLTSKMHLKQKLFLHRLQDGGNLLTHIFDFKEIVSDLATMEVTYDEEDLGLILLCSLPISYSNIRDTILYSRDTLTLNEVYEALYSKKKMKQMVSTDGSSSSQAEGLSVRGRSKEKGSRGKKGRSKSRGKGKDKTCRYCHKDGHEISECYKLQNKEKRNDKKKDELANCTRDNNSEGEVLAVVAGCTDTNDEWILDSACTYHMCPHRNWFTTFEPIRNGRSVLGFDDSQCKIEGIGSIRIKMLDGTIRTLTDVRFIPMMKRNLISLSVFDNKGYKYSGGDGVLKVSKGSLVVIKADLRKSNGLYYLRGTTIIGSASPVTSPTSLLENSSTSSPVLSTVSSETDAVKIWHCRLGHMSELGLSELNKRGLLEGFDKGKLEF